MYDTERLNLLIREHLAYQEEELTTAILYYFYEHKLYNIIDYRSYTKNECTLISEITRTIKEKSRSITNIEIMAYLHRVPIFSTLGSEELYQLAKKTKRMSFRGNNTIVRQGDSGDSFYIITEGNADVTIEKNGESTYLATLSSGDYIGEVSIVSNTKRTATVTTQGVVNVLQLSSKAFDELLNRHPHLALRIMKDITSRLLEQNSI